MMANGRDITDIVAELQGISNNLLLLGNYIEAGDSVDRPTPQTLTDAIWANMRHIDYVIHELDDYDLIQRSKRQLEQQN